MTVSERYIQEVLRRVLAPEADRRRLEEDLRAHFAAGESRGETPQEIARRLGDPDDVAGSFQQDHPLEPAGFWLRTVAFAGDLGVIMLLLFPFAALTMCVASRYPGPGQVPAPVLVLMTLTFITLVGIGVFYFPLLEARFGRTLGKQLLAIRVIGESRVPISLGQAFVRRLSLYFELLVPDALFVPFTEGRRRALDILAKTRVVREPERATEAWTMVVCLAIPVAALSLFLLAALACGV